MRLCFLGAKMKIAAAADLHGFLWDEIPECDVMLLAGDLLPFRETKKQYLSFLDKRFREWLEYVKVPVIACAGNHDEPFERWGRDVARLNLPWTYLEDDYTIFNGFKIYGTPWTKKFGDWSFMLPEHKLIGKWNNIPEDTDILLSHGPPKFYGDLTRDGNHEGSESLTWRIQQICPKLVLFGHIHEGRGEYQNSNTLMMNVSFVDRGIQPINGFWIGEI
jgi:Icc-related predicted phosphoesterase